MNPLREPSVSSPVDVVPQRIRTLWLRMSECYGHRWTSAYGEDAGAGAGLTWTKGLAKLTNEQLARGITQAIASADPWPPTLPAFRAMCLGIPSLGAVKHELRHGKGMRSPFLRLVWDRVDGYLFARADVDKADRMLAEAYQLAAEYVMLGGPMPQEAAGAIEQQKPVKPVRASRETAERHLAEIAKKLRIGEEE